jgi:hypothetical protein
MTDLFEQSPSSAAREAALKRAAEDADDEGSSEKQGSRKRQKEANEEADKDQDKGTASNDKGKPPKKDDKGIPLKQEDEPPKKEDKGTASNDKGNDGDDKDDCQQRTIQKMMTICTEGDLYVSAEVADALIKAGPNHVAAHFEDKVYNLHVRKANWGGYQLQWKPRDQNLWQDKWGATWHRAA